MQLLLSTLYNTSIYLLVALSFSIHYYTTKSFQLALAAFITLGAYLVFFFSKQLLLSLFPSIVCSIIIVLLTGILLELSIFRFIRKIKNNFSYSLLVSLGIYVIFQNSISLLWGDDTKIIGTGEVIVGHEIFGAYIATTKLITIGVSLVLFLSVNLFMQFSSTGKSIRAVSSNPELSNIYGIHSNKIILIAFGIGSALAAITGILSAMDTNMTPTFGFNLLLYGVVAMIIGGVGSTRGLIAGSLLVATAQHLAAYYIDTKWMDAVTYIILILFLIWKPLGFSGKLLKKVEL